MLAECLVITGVGNHIDGVWLTATHFEQCMYIYAVLSGYFDLVYIRKAFKETSADPIYLHYLINCSH